MLVWLFTIETIFAEHTWISEKWQTNNCANLKQKSKLLFFYCYKWHQEVSSDVSNLAAVSYK